MTKQAEKPTNYPEEFEKTLTELTGFKDYFSNKDKINNLVDCIHDETNINKSTLV